MAEDNQRYQAWQGYAALFTILSSIASYFLSLQLWLKILIIVITVVFIAWYITILIKTNGWNYTIMILSGTRNDDDVYRSLYSIHTDLIIDLKDQGCDATYTQEKLLECKIQGANKFFSVITPHHNITNVTITDCASQVSQIVEDAVHTTAMFSQPCDIDDRIHIKMTADISGLFSDKENWWVYKKFYHGNDVVHINILFPKNFPPDSSDAEIIPEGHRKKRRKTKKAPTLTTKHGRPILIVKTSLNELKVGEQLSVKWTWNQHPMATNNI